jgi:hypothetical protein
MRLTGTDQISINRITWRRDPERSVRKIDWSTGIWLPAPGSRLCIRTVPATQGTYWPVKTGVLTVLMKRPSRKSDHLPQFETEILECFSCPLSRRGAYTQGQIYVLPDPTCKFRSSTSITPRSIPSKYFPILLSPFILPSTLGDIFLARDTGTALR